MKPTDRATAKWDRRTQVLKKKQHVVMKNAAERHAAKLLQYEDLWERAVAMLQTLGHINEMVVRERRDTNPSGRTLSVYRFMTEGHPPRGMPNDEWCAGAESILWFCAASADGVPTRPGVGVGFGNFKYIYVDDWPVEKIVKLIMLGANERGEVES